MTDATPKGAIDDSSPSGLGEALDRAVQVAQGGPEDSLRLALFRENMSMLQRYGGERFNRRMNDATRRNFQANEVDDIQMNAVFASRADFRCEAVVALFRSVMHLILLEWGPEPEEFMRDYETEWKEQLREEPDRYDGGWGRGR